MLTGEIKSGGKPPTCSFFSDLLYIRETSPVSTFGGARIYLYSPVLDRRIAYKWCSAEQKARSGFLRFRALPTLHFVDRAFVSAQY